MSTPVPDPLVLVEGAYRQHYETAPARASISFVGVESIEILRYEEAGYPEPPGQGRLAGHGPESVATSYLTLGMSRHPMAEPSATMVDASAAPRGELLLSVLGRPDDVWHRLAVLAAAPVVESAVYRVGMRVELGEPWCAGSRCAGAVVVPGPLADIPVPGISAVTVFRLLPAAPVELAWARVHGSESLLAQWRSAGTELRDLYRDPAVLR
ncbi:MAG TPA: suppressor of fused domain protein [Jatrophihabitans sp.]|nr:suppressor of fused domain protein [Jatrophihabitans sp.]